MLEKEVEKKLVRSVKAKGGICFKFNSLSMVGIPDRLVLMQGGRLAFVELKRKGKKPRPLQRKRMKDLKNLGFKCFVIDEATQIGGVIDEILSP